MKVSVQWLNEFMSHNLSAPEMGEAVEKSGIELEQIISSTKLDRGIVVGLVKKVTQHPNADRLRLADVEIGSDTTLHVVCGAPNLAEGQKVALARAGTVMPDGLEIKKTEIRGETSNGMICSGRELGVSDDHAGIMVLPHDYPLGRTLCDIWDSGEILDVSTAANRSDLQSVLGLGREIAAKTAQKLKTPVDEPKLTTKTDPSVVKAVDVELVERYMLAKVKIEKAGESPLWLQDRLVASGVRPVNAVVDITNYVMLEYGQPLHAFDAEQVKLPISVRLAKSGEKLTTLDGTDRKLAGEDLVIADSNAAIGVAGVMGGASSEIRETTREILLESATFDRTSVRKSAQRHGLRTEASGRFERGLPSELAPYGIARALQLFKEYCGAENPEVIVDVKNTQSKRREVKLRPAHVENLLGMPVKNTTIVQKLSALGFEVTSLSDELVVTIPWWRPDVKLAEDLVEEVGRGLGYDDLPPTLPSWRPENIEFDNRWAKSWKLKSTLLSLNLFEVVTYSFVSQQLLEDFGEKLVEHLKLKNPLSTEQAYLRSNLLPSLAATVAKNAKYSKDFGIFELSKVYEAGSNHKKQPAEPYHVGVVSRKGYIGVKAALDLISRSFNVDLEVLPKPQKGLHPLRSAEVILNRKVVGSIGEVHPDTLAKYKIGGALGYLELDLGSIFALDGNVAPEAISKFPSISRDLALVLPEATMWKQVKHVIAELNLCKAAFLNDYYGNDLPQGTKSMAVRLTFSSMERTLTDKEADEGAERVLRALATKLGAKLRA